MKRNISKKLMAWKDSSSRKPLIIRGARQVGKTYTVKEFGSEHFSNVVVLDFERDRSLNAVFEKDLDPKKLLIELEIHTGSRIIPGETLLFFDEIQACERALLSLRYFYEEMPELHIIAAGSLLEFAMSNISFPVGRVTFEWMRPMTFREFLIACSKDIAAQRIPSIFSSEPVLETLHNLLIEQLRLYFIVGGMPEAVKRFIETGSAASVKEVHDDIIHSYIQSLAKYNSKVNIESIEQILRVIPSKVGSQIKYTHLDPDRRIEVTKTSLNILEKALLVNLIHSSSVSGLPLGAESSSKIFKPLFLDIGLMQSVCGIDPKESITATDLNNVYKGAIAEQFVGQELLAAGGSENHKLYYWNRSKKSSTAEVDFVFVRNSTIYPVEVKSGAKGRMKSMHLFLEEHPEIKKGFVLSSTFSQHQLVENIVFAPIYSELG
ncbi:MAG TPA: AAA family ATPase [bacterium]|nr:AAA family ATPase [bacterium]HPV20013.1 AAA family ATPase [bacterium]HPY14760.1 AAA family ATPase [bacterium]HQB09185.1 AAA family ATPase [bacterium]HQM84048.1 AAA family ATPase [bacterium]